jgi:L-threonylcarbamoyladenylate synthase
LGAAGAGGIAAIIIISPAGDPREAAANLFRMRRQADREEPAGIAVAAVPSEGLGEAINDRLRRAAGFVG